MLSVKNKPIMQSVIMLSVIMQSVIRLSVIMLSVIMLNVIIASVMAPFSKHFHGIPKEFIERIFKEDQHKRPDLRGLVLLKV
jgi:hypothetical protein